MLLPDGRRLRTLTTWLPHEQSVETLSYTPDGSVLVTAASDAVRVWNITGTAPTLVREFPGDDSLDACAAAGPNGLVAISKDDSTTLVVNVRTGATVTTIRAEGLGMASMPSLSRRGDLVLSQFAVWAVPSGRRVRHASFLGCFSPTTDTQVTVDDQVAEILDARSGRRLRSISVAHPSNERATALAVSADGRHAVVGTGPEGVWFLDLVRNVGRRADSQSPPTARAAACSHDGALAVTSNGDGTLLWSGRTASVLHTLPAGAAALAWAPNRPEFATTDGLSGAVALHRVEG